MSETIQEHNINEIAEMCGGGRGFFLSKYDWAQVYVDTGWGDIIHPIGMLLHKQFKRFVILHDKDLSYKSHPDDKETFGDQLFFILFELYKIPKDNVCFNKIKSKPENQNKLMQTFIKARPAIAKINYDKVEDQSTITYQWPYKTNSKELLWKQFNVDRAKIYLNYLPTTPKVELSYRDSIKETYEKLKRSRCHYGYYGSAMWLAYAMDIPIMLFHSAEKSLRIRHIKKTLSILDPYKSRIKLIRLDRD